MGSPVHAEIRFWDSAPKTLTGNGTDGRDEQLPKKGSHQLERERKHLQPNLAGIRQ